MTVVSVLLALYHIWYSALVSFDTITKKMVVQIYMGPIISVTANGFLLEADGVQYVLEWVGEKLLVTGPDTCYYLVETLRGLEQFSCTLTTSVLLLQN